MARRKKDASNGALENLEIDVPDVTAAVMPEGTPTTADGSISEGDDISVEQARKIGAIDTASAQHNRRVARTIHKKITGQPVRWNESDAIMAFDNVKRAFDPSTLWIVIQRKEPGVPDEDYQPILMSSFKDSSALYDHVLRKIHKSRPSTTYLVRFKDGGGQRTQGFLRMPDTTNDLVEQKGPDMQQGQPPPYPPIALPGGGYAYPQQGGYPQQQYPYGYQQPQNGYQQQPQYPQNGYQQQQQPAPPPPPAPAPVAAAPAPVVQPPPPQAAPTHETYFYPPSPPQRDPGLDAAVATTYKELQDMKQMTQQTLLQNERLLGELTEMRRTQLAYEQRPQYQPPPAPVAPPAPPIVMTPYGPQQSTNGQVYGPPNGQQQYQQPPPQYGPPIGQPAYGAHVPMPAPQRHAEPQQYGGPPQYQQPPQYAPQPSPYGQPPQGAPQPVQNPQWNNGAPAPAQPRGWQQPGVGAPPQQQQPQQPPPQDAMGQFSNTMGQAVTMISGMTRAMAEIQRTVGNSTQVNPPPEYEDEDDLPNIPPPPPDQPKPFHTMPLGFGESAPVYAYNEDGSPNVTGMILGNLPKAGAWLQGLGNGVASVLQAQRSARGGPGVGQLPEAPVQQPVQYMQPAQPAQQAPVHPAKAPASSMMPSLASIRTAMGK